MLAMMVSALAVFGLTSSALSCSAWPFFDLALPSLMMVNSGAEALSSALGSSLGSAL